MSTIKYEMFFDGCSKGNPGAGGAGAVIYADGEEISAQCVYVGNHVTNNYSEYTGIKIGLERALELDIKRLTVYGDSLLVVKQMAGLYKVKSSNLLEIYTQCLVVTGSFEKIEFIHVYRDKNKRADQLSNDGLLLA